MDLPIFTYNPHPLKNNCIIKSDKVCQVCNKKIGYIVTSIMATAFDNIYDICPWCIADGSACRKYNGEFVYYIENAKNISKEILDTISCKTVSFPAHYTTPRKPNNFTENLIPKIVKLDDKYRGAKI